MSSNKNDPPNNAGASSSPFGHLIPSNPTDHLQTQPQSLPQQPSASNFSNDLHRTISQYIAQRQAINPLGSGSPNTSSMERYLKLIGALPSSKKEERTNDSSLTSKRPRMETSSPNKKTNLPSSSNNEADAGGTTNSSDTAKSISDVLRERQDVLRERLLARNSSPMGYFGNFLSHRGLHNPSGPGGELSRKLRNIDPRLVEQIRTEIMDVDPNVRWDDIAGLHHAKKCVTEMVIWPFLRPEIFKGCRSPGKGLLLFGPPGTGKTMIGKAIAGECKATFFYISASSVTSKWLGDSEKLVRALFEVAKSRQPAVIFVDEIDSLLSKRKSEGEQESSRRIKTQFLIEMEGFDTGSDQVLLIGATNRPQDLDEAARRRLTKRLYIPLPSSEGRASIVRNVLNKDGLLKLSTEEIDTICKLTEGYSGSDMNNLVKDASMGPVREALKQGTEITNLKLEDMRPVNLQDFEDALQEVRPSVSPNDLGSYEEWNKEFGSLSPSTK